MQISPNNLLNSVAGSPVQKEKTLATFDPQSKPENQKIEPKVQADSAQAAQKINEQRQVAQSASSEKPDMGDQPRGSFLDILV